MKRTIAYVYYRNLHNAALEHKEHCQRNCNVSLIQMKYTANDYLLPFCEDNEVKELKALEWPV